MSVKKTTAIFLSALILMSVICNAFASDVTNRVYADTVTVEAGEQVTVPIKIENNDGFMGFSVIVTYDSSAVTPVSVSKGSMLSGMFNDSIETSTDNSFKVVFTGTSDVVSDGVLFNAVFDVSDSASGTYELELSYSQQDTFKEGWANAEFNCEAVEVVVTVNGTTAPTTVPTTITTTATTVVPTTEPTTVTAAESTTIKKDETTTKSVPAEPSTTEPEVQATTTQPVTEPSSEPADEPDTEKTLSVRMKEWVGALPFPLNILLGIFVYPIAFVISIFE